MTGVAAVARDGGDESVVEHALVLAQAGWPVFPVRRDNKAPMVKRGVYAATTDPKQIRAWAGRFQRGCIATPTGNGKMVVDVDPRNGGEVPGWLPDTLTVRTGGGGWHFWYAIDEDVKSRAGFFGPGVDSKCRGGYVLVPPSMTSSGPYTWETDLPMAWLRADDVEARAVAAGGTGGKGGIERKPPEDVRRGEFHDQVLAWAGYFASLGHEDADVERLTWEVVGKFGETPDNRNAHIDEAISWVLSREAKKARGTS